jgi:hypothetical protein
MLWLWIILGVVGLLALAFFVMSAIGKGLDPKHVVTASLHVNRTPAEVHALVADLEAWPTWCRNVQKVEKLPDRDGHPMVRMHMGRNRMVLKVTVNHAPTRFAMTIDDESKFFAGVWEYHMNAEVNGTRLKLTEHGEVRPALPRFMLKYLVDPSKYLKSHLRDVATRFGEPPQISDARRLS